MTMITFLAHYLAYQTWIFAQSEGFTTGAGVLVGALPSTAFSIWYGYYMTTVVQPRMEERHAKATADAENECRAERRAQEERHNRNWEIQEQRHHEERTEWMTALDKVSKVLEECRELFAEERKIMRTMEGKVKP